MKYIVIIGDGMSDYPLDELNGKTPLEYANIPNMDKIAKLGKCGLTNNVIDKYNPGSDVANMSIFGFDPDKYYTARGPLEAGNYDVKTSENDIIFRCNTISNKDGILYDFNASHISSEEAEILLNDLNKYFTEKYPDFKGKFYPGISYRHIFIYSAESDKISDELCSFETFPPHDILDEPIDKYTNWDSEYSKLIKKIMMESYEFLSNHPVNKAREDKGLNPANMVWLWSQGVVPKFDPFTSLYGIKAAVITGVDLLKGIANYGKIDVIDVPGATAYFDTDYVAKGQYAIDNIDDYDLIFVHIEAPDEAGHAKNVEEKVKAIESIDKYILGPIWEYLDENYDEYKIAVLPDHPTPIPVGTHTRDDIPQAIYTKGGKADNVKSYTESNIAKGSLKKEPGYKLVNRLINDD
ncbi:cofactor-independent phosphoglycerate mutase [Methanobrevibacter sp.]